MAACVIRAQRGCIRISQDGKSSVAVGYVCSFEGFLSYDVASGSEITPCNKIDKPLVIYRFMGNVMTSTTTLRT